MKIAAINGIFEQCIQLKTTECKFAGGKTKKRRKRAAHLADNAPFTKQTCPHLS